MAGENTFTAGTLLESSKVQQNFTGAYTGDFDETENSLRTFRDESLFDHVVSGGVITDPGASLSQTTTAVVALIDGRRVTIGATAKTYTASKDTYVDILRSGTAASYVYTEVSNNAASPALASNSIRIAIVTTNGSEITNSNQGQETQVIPIASSVAYSVTDSRGNLICPRDATRQILGYKTITTGISTTTSHPSFSTATGLECPVIVPTGRKIEIEVNLRSLTSGSSFGGVAIYETSTAGTKLKAGYVLGVETPVAITVPHTPSSTNVTYIAAITAGGGGTCSITAASGEPSTITVRLR